MRHGPIIEARTKKHERSKTSKKINKAWLNDHVNDTYVKLAQKFATISRARRTGSKLSEIDEQFGLVRSGATVVDLGCAPGAWRASTCRRLSPEGLPQALNGAIIGLTSCPWSPSKASPICRATSAKLRCWRSSRDACKAVRWMWWCRTWRPIFRASHRPTPRAYPRIWWEAVDFASAHLQPEGHWSSNCSMRAGYSELVQLFRETFMSSNLRQAEGFPRQIIGNLPGRYRSEEAWLRETRSDRSDFSQILILLGAPGGIDLLCWVESLKSILFRT